MPIPEGYEKLAVIGIVNKGEYSGGGEYKQYNYVYYEGSTYLALKDNPTVPPTNNKVDWQYLAQGVVGAKGDKGEPGAKGEQGVSITDARIEEGVLHITLSDERDITVGSVAITKDAVVDALGYTPVGGQGVNLIPYSKIKKSNCEAEINPPLIIVKGNGAKPQIVVDIDLEPNTTYTVSFDIEKIENPSTTMGVFVLITTEERTIIKNQKFTETGRYIFAFDTPNVVKKATVTLNVNDTNDILEKKCIVTCRNLKLEPGIVTDPVWTPAPEDVVVRSELPTSLNLIFPQNAGAHNSVFRGNNLGTSVTEAQYAAINNGSFDDIFVGDYWTINDTIYRVAGLDILLHTGDIELTKHHAVIVPDANMYSHVMNDTDITTNAYYGSKMKTSGLNSALSTIKTDFGEGHVIKHKVLLANAVSGDNPSGWVWQSTEIDLMTERQVYGSPAWGQAGHNGYDANMQYSRFPLFSLAPEYICKYRSWYWLQDVQSASHFCAVDNVGDANGTGASSSGGVRPYFLIG